MNITFFVAYGDECDDYTIVQNESETVREMIIHVLKELKRVKIIKDDEITDKEIDEGGKKYCFIFGQKYISFPNYLDKTLKQIGLKDNRKLKIMKLSGLVPA